VASAPGSTVRGGGQRRPKRVGRGRCAGTRARMPGRRSAGTELPRNSPVEVELTSRWSDARTSRLRQAAPQSPTTASLLLCDNPGLIDPFWDGHQHVCPGAGQRDDGDRDPGPDDDEHVSAGCGFSERFRGGISQSTRTTPEPSTDSRRHRCGGCARWAAGSCAVSVVPCRTAR